MCKWGTYSYRSGHPVAVDRLLMKMRLPPVLSYVQVTYKVEDSSPLILLSSDWWSYADVKSLLLYHIYIILPPSPTHSLFMPQILKLLYMHFIANVNKTINDLLRNFHPRYKIFVTYILYKL